MFAKKPTPHYRQVSASDEDDNIHRGDSDDDEEEEDFIQQQIRLQRKQLKKQDEGLEMLSKQASRLGELSLVIAEEVAYQSRTLDGIDHELEQTQASVNYLNLKTKELIKSAGGKRNCLIILLMSLIVLILIILIIYT